MESKEKSHSQNWQEANRVKTFYASDEYIEQLTDIRDHLNDLLAQLHPLEIDDDFVETVARRVEKRIIDSIEHAD